MRSADPGQRIWRYDPQLYGSARWADAAHLAERGYGERGCHVLGYLPAERSRERARRITYGGARHRMIVAPTRGGKAVSGSVPLLLDHAGSAVVIDLKDGELAQITARYRERVFGQRIHIIDPFDRVCARLGRNAARLNPLGTIDLDGDEPFDCAMEIGQACVIAESQGESHWSGEAEAMIAGLALRECEKRRDGAAGDLAAVRAALNRDRDGFAAYVAGMLESPYELVRSAGGRIDNKAERERSGVISTAHRNTHFLESAKLAASLSASDIDLNALGQDTTVYIALPARRLRAAKRWLRVVLASLIAAVGALPERPDPPVLFLLEEMAALERMSVIEQSFSLMAGYGLQFCNVVQDFTQLRDLYQDRWETFLANSAAIQCFGTNDLFTARYLSALCGSTTAERLSYDSAFIRSSLFGDPAHLAPTDSAGARSLVTPDELVSMHPCTQLIVLAGARPAMAYRTAYFLDARHRSARGTPLFDAHPRETRPPRPIDFLRPGLDLGAALAPYLGVG
ncbi:MAG: type IV secretory system conjugative DNA transfer family protein [Erythrobacter sp.]|jgi:type IV secretion system protein VirD4|nr:type IV secretory system conjugative DNA transfer family protein [Erythrobacter sp.]